MTTQFINEKDVENFYRKTLTDVFSDMVITSPYGCDGYGESKKSKIKVICEFKDDLDLTLKVNQVKILAQAIYYIKKFELSAPSLPSVILVGDRNECFVIHVNDIFKYLGMNFDWGVAPSKAHTNVELVTLMMGDDKINPFIFNIKDIKGCIDKLKDLNDGVKRLVPITPHNVTKVFETFENEVIGVHKLDTNQLANLFVQLLINPEENYLHPILRRRTIVTKAFNEVNLKSRDKFISFFEHFSREYSPRQREHLTAVVDRLVQDVTRRKQGEFFTPTIWVDKAHEYIASVYGEDWKEKYVVWDPAWGTGNLTRDYKFKELYCSTLIYADIETANQMGYNPEATKFQYDFLNHPYEYLPKGLKKAIESGKKIIVLINPPYIKSTPNKGNITSGISETIIGEEMNNKKMGIASSQLSSQFLYRLIKLKDINDNIKIAIFNKPNFMTSDGFKELRLNILKSFGYVTGFLFNASHFSDTANSWGVSFSIWDNLTNDVKNCFLHNILGLDIDYKITEIENKNLYNCDGLIKANNIFNIKTKNNTKLPPIKSYLTIDHSKIKMGNLDAVGYINNDSNNLMQQNVVFLGSSVISANGNKTINKDNFTKVVSLFSARKIVLQNWINDKDEYLAPNEEHEQYQQFTYDSIVYSLFNNSSQQSSLRQITYKEQLWDIKNEFFWLSKSDMMELANNNNYTEIYNDARTSDDRYVHKLLFGEQNIYNQLSPDARLVLDSATNLLRDTMVMRMNMADNTNHLNSWDAGYAQLKLVWKEYYPERFKEFRELYKILENRMRPMVYELGFLMK